MRPDHQKAADGIEKSDVGGSNGIRAAPRVEAPRDHHMLIGEGATRLWRGPKKHHTRPAIGPLFRSAYSSSEDAIFVGQPAEDVMESLKSIAHPSTLVCTDCGGALWEVRNSRPVRYRCHTGHAFTLRSLAESMKVSTGLALQSAIRSIQEQAILLRRAAAVSRASDALAEAEVIEADAARLEAHVRLLEGMIQAGAAVRSMEPMPPDAPGPMICRRSRSRNSRTSAAAPGISATGHIRRVVWRLQTERDP